MKGLFILSVLSLVVLANHSVADQSEAFSDLTELRKLAKKGDLHAELQLGMRYRDGRGIARDYREALSWYRRCADKGSTDGMDNVGFMYLKGWGVPVDFNIAAAYFKAAATKNNSQALFNLGNCYFSGQGVEQNYELAIDSWRRSAKGGNQHAVWRLATLKASGEGLLQDWEEAEELCDSIARKGNINGMLLLGELNARQGKLEVAQKWWDQAAKLGSKQANALLEISKWRDQESVAGKQSYVEVDHIYQGWNNCGATSIAMFARQGGSNVSPYDLKRLCPKSPIGTGTDWEDLLATGKNLDQKWEMLIFSNDDAGFSQGLEAVRNHLDARHPVVIDFTVTRDRDGEIQHFGHTLIVVGYHLELDQYILKNPNQPSPGIQIMSAEELEKNWYSGGYSRLAKGIKSRPLIVMKAQ